MCANPQQTGFFTLEEVPSIVLVNRNLITIRNTRPAREVIQTPLWWPTYLFMKWTNQKFVSLQWKCFMLISSYKKREGQSVTIWLHPKQYISQGICICLFEKGGVIFYKSHMDIWYVLHDEYKEKSTRRTLIFLSNQWQGLLLVHLYNIM